MNDRFGHKAGDAVLRVVGQRLLAVTREGDVLARLGGDEFALLARDLESKDRAYEVARRLSSALDADIVVEGHGHRIAASIGIALFPEDGATADDILHAADTAMYRAKKQGVPTVIEFQSKPGRLSA